MEEYKDIINLPYKKSTRHKPMSMNERAGQFSSFNALDGFDDAIDDETEIIRISTEAIENNGENEEK